MRLKLLLIFFLLTLPGICFGEESQLDKDITDMDVLSIYLPNECYYNIECVVSKQEIIDKALKAYKDQIFLNVSKLCDKKYNCLKSDVIVNILKHAYKNINLFNKNKNLNMYDNSIYDIEKDLAYYQSKKRSDFLGDGPKEEMYLKNPDDESALFYIKNAQVLRGGINGVGLSVNITYYWRDFNPSYKPDEDLTATITKSCTYGYICLMTAEDFQHILPENFHKLNLHDDINITYFRSSKGIYIDHSLNSTFFTDSDSVLEYLMPLQLQYEDAGEEIIKGPNELNQYKDVRVKFNVKNPAVIKGTENGRPFTLYLNIYWYQYL